MTGAWLLLAEGSGGTTRRILDCEIADGPPEQSADLLVVGRASVNDAVSGDLSLSLRTGAQVALRLLSREYGRQLSLERVSVTTEALSADVVGRSAELALALTVFLRIAEAEDRCAASGMPFAATGALDRSGNVGSVERLAAKIEALLQDDALRAHRAVFYPRVDSAQLDEALRRRCAAQGVELRPVDRLDEALSQLGVPVRGWWEGSPFRALEAFEREHSRIFFGRRAEVAALRDLLRRRAADGAPGALILGASGAGKSSFCLAGLLPALEGEAPGLRHAVWRPREAAAAAGGRIGEADIARSILAAWGREDASQSGLDLGGAGDTLADLLPPPRGPDDPLRIWVVDQFEELFTLDFAPEARLAVARFMRGLQARGVWVIGTLRNEFYAAYQELLDDDGAPVLVGTFGPQGLFDLPRMGRDALRQVILRPAELADLRFETRAADGVRLDDRLLVDAMDADDALPLLEFALQELYQRSEPGPPGPDGETPRQLGFAAYDAIGGLKGAIGSMAEAAFAGLDPQAQATLPQLLSALATPSDGDRRETARPAHLDAWPPQAPIHRLIAALVARRVVVRDDHLIRIAHEALFTHWNEAARTLSASRQARQQIEELEGRRARWQAGGRPDEWLLTSVRDLDTAASLRAVLSTDRSRARLIDYIDASIAQYSRSVVAETARQEASLRGARRRAVAFGALSLVLAIALLFAGSKTVEAVQARDVANSERNNAKLSAEVARKAAVVADRERRSADTERRKANVATERALRINASLIVQQGLTLTERNHAVAARELTQNALDRTVRRLTSVEFEEDAEFDKIQSAVLAELNPIYRRQLKDGPSSTRTILGYADMIDRTARLSASTQSIDAGLANYAAAWEVIDRAGLADAPDTLLDTFVENRAALYLALGDPDAAAKALSARTRVASVPESRACTQFRIGYLRNGSANTDLAEADRTLKQVEGWSPTSSTPSLYRMGCLADLTDLYIYYNEDPLAREALALLKTSADQAVRDHFRSISFRAMLVRAAVAETQLDPDPTAPPARLVTSEEQAGLRSDDELLSSARQKASVNRAEALLGDMIKLSPEKRIVLESRLGVRLAKRRVSFGGKDDETKAAWASDTDWMDSFADLIVRDPDSPSLQRRYGDSVRTAIGGLLSTGEGSIIRTTGCRALLEKSIATASRFGSSPRRGRGGHRRSAMRVRSVESQSTEGPDITA